MNPSTPNLFGIHTRALDLWQRRTEVLANNLANADTPGYLARDVDFRKVLATASDAANGVTLETDAPGQIAGAGRSAEALAYRVPTQPGMDGNTVDAQVEQAAFAANGVHYQASLSFITAQIRMLRMAINGGQG
ncbi:flagellar basal body rod protein FlgB [Rhodanobacter sp. UC4450_H17]